jgi:hypothetical protein
MAKYNPKPRNPYTVTPEVRDKLLRQLATTASDHSATRGIANPLRRSRRKGFKRGGYGNGPKTYSRGKGDRMPRNYGSVDGGYRSWKRT